ncbi:hypothetical protein SLA2020_465780 [Shorea laevis]
MLTTSGCAFVFGGASPLGVQTLHQVSSINFWFGLPSKMAWEACSGLSRWQYITATTGFLGMVSSFFNNALWDEERILELIQSKTFIRIKGKSKGTTFSNGSWCLLGSFSNCLGKRYGCIVYFELPLSL